ncbi:PREDICTED: E3 ubiquitin-protein ligase TRIM36 isoform X4 [Propithecus coquereli]|uniref:E3 ubiquitin-protein ligase TRIM36 isoform X4 n=1 Tax=Propithecus coquereli TaxID=379532 RepID=UPI00063FA09B|nr:PREDICTED: E3 ubiquitin-protein ligase TRIM36 isoform X4 [Propithecus coquereli]
MSESGEISEFGYIMELLAKGKVSDRARGFSNSPEHSQGPSKTGEAKGPFEISGVGKQALPGRT